MVQSSAEAPSTPARHFSVHTLLTVPFPLKKAEKVEFFSKICSFTPAAPPFHFSLKQRLLLENLENLKHGVTAKQAGGSKSGIWYGAGR